MLLALASSEFRSSGERVADMSGELRRVANAAIAFFSVLRSRFSAGSNVDSRLSRSCLALIESR